MPSRYGGYTGEILDINLSSGKIGRYDLDDHDRELFLGGKGIAAKILWDNLKPGIDPLSAENIMVIATGPLTGSGAPCTSRFNVSCKNVMTGGIAASNSGGDFGLWLKKAGYDAIIIRGRAEKPVYIDIVDDLIAIRDAAHLWGLDTEKAQEMLPRRRGKMVIGPAGENLVRYACIMSGDRAFGRTGVGAVMGSKNLKALVATGSRKMKVYNPRGFKKAVADWVRQLQKHPVTGGQLPAYGTSGIFGLANIANVLPTRNFQKGHWEYADDVSGETMAETVLVKNSGCTSCPIRCGRVVRAYKDKVVKGPEFETLGMFGPDILNRDLQKICDFNYECDLLGIDTITAGSTIAFAMELHDRGLLNSGLEFGKVDNISQTLRDIAYRRGLGDELAEGSMRLSRKYGAADAAMQSKGLEMAAYEPRSAVGHGLGYAISNRGACHLNGGYMVYFEAVGAITVDPLSPEGKPGLVIFQQNMFDAVSSAGNCLFTTYAVIPAISEKLMPAHGRLAGLVSRAVGAAGALTNRIGKLAPGMLPVNLPLIPHSRALAELTGMEMDFGRFHGAGERVYTIERLFNLREGLTDEDDTLPSRLTDEVQRPGVPATKVPLQRLRPVYYQARNWDDHGVPRPGLLNKLGMGWAVPEVNRIIRERTSLQGMRRSFFANENENLERLLPQNRKLAEISDDRRRQLAIDHQHQLAVEHAQQVRKSSFEINSVLCTGCGLCIKACPVEAITTDSSGKSRIDADLCIACGRCFSACPTNFAAVEAREDARAKKSRAAVIYRVDYDKCKMCGICARKCPVGAIAWDKRRLAVIDEQLCVRCGLCYEVCPDKFSAVEKLTGKRLRQVAAEPPADRAPQSAPPAAVPVWFEQIDENLPDEKEPAAKKRAKKNT